MLAPPPRIWQGPPPPAHVNGAAAATRYGYSSLAQILPSPQDKGDEEQQAGVFPEEPVKLRRETKTGSTDWRRKDRNRIKAEPGTTPCQVQEVTTSSKHDHNGSSIPVGIAVARQRVQQTTPPPLTVLTCEERSTNQVTGWSGPPPHWQYPGVEQSLGVQMPPLQLSRDPISGQLLILPSGNLESMQRAVLWPGGSGTGGNSQPPPLVMPGPQPVLLSDRYVTLAPPPSAAPSSAHHHQEKRRAHDHSTTTIHGSSSGGLAVGLFPPPPPPQAPFLMMPFSHQNNSLLLSTHLTEHNLNTMVVTNHQLSESAAVLNPMEVITSPVDGFGGGGMIQQLPPSVVISHTETNSFVRSDINAVYPSQAQVHSQTSQPPAPPPPLQQERIVVKEEVDHNEETIEDEPIEEEVKTEVMDASNQTESPVEDSEGEEEVMVKVEEKGCITVEEPLPEPDMSGLELLINSIAQIEKKTSSHEETFKPSSPEISHSCEVKMQEDEWKDGNVEDSIKSGLGLLCSVAERCLEEEVVDQEKVELKDFPSPASPPLTDENDQKIDNQLSEDPLSDVSDCEKSSRKEIREKASPEKKGEWYASADLGRDRLKIKIKRRPGRPKKKIKIRKHRSPTRCEPPVLQPWSASIDGTVSPLTSPPTLTPHKRKLSLELSQESDEGSSSSGSHPPPLSPACPSSAKKRKVGRPKKRGDETPPKTELIVTKSVPSSKAIGRILANKSGGTSNQTSSHSPPPQTSVGSHNKIKPKLKAEVKVKQWHDDEDLELSPGKENGLDVPLPSRSPVWKSPTSLKVSALSPGRTLLKTEKEEEQVSPSSSLPVQSNTKHERSLSKIPDCKLTEQHLKSLPWSILSETNGQFFPGKVTKIVAPDIYEVQYQQERWRKPHILCREEILTSSVTEMNIPEDLFVPAGTRVCAYWSHLSCYYPGRVICDSPSGQVLIDFDDGDTGTIERARLRFLPHDYPLVEPPVHRGKRKRYSSTTSSDSLKNNDSIETTVEPENTSTSLSDAYDKAENIKSEVTENVKEENSQDEAEKNSVIDGEGANEIMSVLEHFFQSEALGMERKSRHTDKSHRHHKHHKHRGGCKTHKCKHKHLRSRKHKHSPGEAKRRELDHSTSIDKSNEHLVTPGLTISTDKNASQKGNEESAGTRRATPLANNTKPKTGGFPPAKQEMWSWVGSGTKRGRPLGPRGKGLRICYKAIHRGKEVISVGDCAVFKSIGRRDRPYIGRITSFWQYQMKRNMMVRVSWFYHPEEAIGCPDKLPYPGGVFESAHVDINDVQTITHQCQVLTYLQFHEKAKADPDFVDKVYETHKTFYLAGRYVPAATKLILDPEVEAVCGIQPSEGSTETTKSQEH